MDEAAIWVSHPDEWQPRVREWQASLPSLVVDIWPQYAAPDAGPPARIYALTLGNEDAPFRLLVTVPHAHEPAPTAACVDFIEEWVTGRHRDGMPSALDRQALAEQVLVTLIPDGNPQGRARSPRRVWDGSEFDNEAFLRVAFGVAADGTRFGRYPAWRHSEHRPQSIGIVYEQLGPDEYGEPNTNRRCTLARAVDELFARYGYTHHLEMHQHEGDEAALLPADYDDLAAERRATVDAWARRLIAAWREAGATPRPEPYVAYRGQPRQQFFRDFWAGRCPGMLRLVSEVRNNQHVRTGEPTPLAYQLRMARVALRATLSLAFAQ